MGNLICQGVMTRLAAARLRAGLSQRELADAAGVAQPTVLRIEKGRTLPALDTLEQIARALRVSAAWLAYGSGPMEAGADGPTAGALVERLGVAAQGLANAITGLCDVLGIEMTMERRVLVAGLGVEEMAALIERIQRERAWPGCVSGELAPTIH